MSHTPPTFTAPLIRPWTHSARQPLTLIPNRSAA